MKTVLATGVFDGLHAGHIYFFREARKHGDRLVVIVANDDTAKRFGKNPKHSAKERTETVAACSYVDKALTGRPVGAGSSGNSIFDILEEIRPDVIVIGFDQRFKPDHIREETRKRGHKIEVFQISEFKHENE